MAQKKKVSIEKITQHLEESAIDYLNYQPKLAVVGNGMFIDGVKLDDIKKRDIISEASTLKQSYLLKILLEEMKSIGAKKIFNEGTTDGESIIVGKSILYTIDVLEKKIKNLSILK